MSEYLIDSNVFIQAKNLHYGIDFCPAFWDWLLEQKRTERVADYWLVSHALAHDCTVVTHEVPVDTVQEIKIPNACIGLGLRCISTFEMLRRERARFVLGAGRAVN